MSMDKLKRMLRLHEGLKLKAYLCTAGRKTIGIGRNLDDNPLTPAEIAHLGRANIAETGITEDEAWWLLDSDLAKTTAELNRALPWITTLDEVRRAVLVDMAYNIGVPKLKTFRATLPMIQAGQYAEAAKAMMLSLWATQVKTRAKRLSHMMETGQWPDDLPV